jgi:hypothetical protein
MLSSQRKMLKKLTSATYFDQLDKVQRLIKKGADPHLSNDQGDTILHLAARRGCLGIYLYLVIRFPELLYLQNNQGMTPDQVAERHQQGDIVRFNLKDFSNTFFSSVKKHLPEELVLMIASETHDMATLESLSLVNKSWHALVKESLLKSEFENYVRRFLPENLQEATWYEVILHYYPNLTNDSWTSDCFLNNCTLEQLLLHLSNAEQKLGAGVERDKLKEWMTMKTFIRMISTFYIAGEKMALLDNKDASNEPELALHRYQNLIATACSSASNIRAFRSLELAAKEEYDANFMDAEGSFCRFRQPIFQLSIRADSALAHLKRGDDVLMLSPKDIICVKNYRLAKENFELADRLIPSVLPTETHCCPVNLPVIPRGF